MLTIFTAPTHAAVRQIEMPRLADDFGLGPQSFRRKWPRGLSRWELIIPGSQEELDPVIGMLEFAQGDNYLWFDGAGFNEQTTPVIIGEGNGVNTDYILPHKYTYCASFLLYYNDQPTGGWYPLDGDQITMGTIRTSFVAATNTSLKAKFRWRSKVTVRVEDKPEHARQFRSPSDSGQTVATLKVYLDEVPV